MARGVAALEVGGEVGVVDRTSTDDRTKAPSPAADRALMLLEELVHSDGDMTLTALAKRAGIPLATCGTIMQTLELRGYAARTVIGRSHLWRATLKLNGLAAELVGKLDLSELARPYLQRLIGQFPMAAHFGALEGDLVIYLAKVGTQGMVQFNTFPGKATPYHLTALGRAIAAHLPEQQLATLIKGRAPGRGPGSRPTSVAGLRRIFAEVREQGYAVELEEEDEGLGCVAAACFDAHGSVVGAIGVTTFAERLRGGDLDELARRIVAEAGNLTRTRVGGGLVR